MGAVFFPLQRCCASRSIFSGKSRSISASSRATRRRGTGLDGKTSDIDLPPMGPLLPENEDSGAVDKITPPQPLRFAEQAKHPFEARARPPQGRADLRPGTEPPPRPHKPSTP